MPVKIKFIRFRKTTLFSFRATNGKSFFQNLNTMIFNFYFKRSTVSLLILFSLAVFAVAQPEKLPVPRQEKLLNNVKMLIWSQPEAEKVRVILRINRGSAFDQLGKEGQMALLAQIIFPDQISREFFEEDLGGSLEIETNYDYLQINTTAEPDQILTVLQTLANAVISPQIDKETTAKVRAEQIEKVKELDQNPAYLADLAVRQRLLGDFPYGRPQMGTVESLNKIDFADLIFARQRFLTADNATLVIIGNVKSDLVYRAARRYFGSWLKADEQIPATFRLPDPPEKSLKLIETEKENASELRLAFRGLARGDKDYYASEILGLILNRRLQQSEGNEAIVKNNPHFLPGLVLVELPDWKKVKNGPEGLSIDTESIFSGLLAQTVSQTEFSSAKNEVLSRFNSENLAQLWLDLDTFNLNSFKGEYQKAQNAKIEDVKRIAGVWTKEPFASVLVYQKSKPSETESSNN